MRIQLQTLGRTLLRAVRRRTAAEDGFTLVELVMTTAILGVITATLAGVVLSYLRTTVDTQARMTESHDVQFAAAYWQRDVASIGVRSSTYDSTTHSFALEQSVGVAPCGLPAGTTAVVTLAWSEYSSLVSTDTPATVKVTYAARPTGTGHELLRVRCGSQPSTVQIADNLSAVPTVACENAAGAAIPCTGSGDDVPAVVRLALSVDDGADHDAASYAATLSGERRQS
ncbi:MAG TPA: type II secretion system protein [Nocardioides sp.]|uniref:PulJ/GspJ family protein n=1 Tax=Nocardioides sp. TaxID=35761 RepID=UPI002ED97CF5